MNFEDFYNNVPFQILQRGKQYFKNNNIVSCEYSTLGKWEAVVSGNSGNYKVNVVVENNAVVKHHCNCPYDGDICKHVVSVLYRIDEISDNNGELNSTVLDSNSTNDIPEWKQIILEMSSEDLRVFTLKMATDNQIVRDEVLLLYSNTSENTNIDYYKSKVSESFEEYDDYYNSYSRNNCEFDDLKNKADRYMKAHNYYEAFSVYAGIIEGLIESIEMINDSDGELGMTFEHSLESIDKILGFSKDKKLNDAIYEWLEIEMANSEYSNYGLDGLDDVYIKHTNIPERVDGALKFINEELEKLSKNEDGWSSKYKTEKLLKQKHQLFLNVNRITDSENLVEDNLKIDFFRDIKIEQLLNSKDFNGAIECIKKGIELSKEDKFGGLEHKYKSKLLSIYQELKDVENIKTISLDLYKDNLDNFEYYRVFKKTIAKADWLEERDKLLNLFKQKTSSNYFSNNYAQFLVYENLIPQLFDYVSNKAKIEDVISFTKYLKEDYSNELLDIYVGEIRKVAINTGRSTYVELVGYINMLSKLGGGKEVAIKLKNELLEEYKNRPAMKDEFKALEL